jgi:hypothetical protein
MKSLNTIENVDEKLAALGRKYCELLEEHKVTQTQLKNNQRSLQVLSKEKEQLQSEHGKIVLAKSKLESLCRELQRHNKLVKDESMARAKEDDEKRKEITTRFQSTINDIQTQMSDNYDKNSALREENLELANKLKGLIEQYELREKQIDKIIETKEIETQLYDAKLQQAVLQISEAKEKHLHDKQLLMKELLESQGKMLLMEEQEKALKAQVAMYTEKYDEFQSTLTKSNDVFNNFKSEMEKMSKKMRKLEKDTMLWKQKFEGSQRALIEMAEQKAGSDKTLVMQQNKISKLESLCRALQEERKLYTAVAATTAAAASLAAADSAPAATTAAAHNGTHEPDTSASAQVVSAGTPAESTSDSADLPATASAPVPSTPAAASSASVTDTATTAAASAAPVAAAPTDVTSAPAGDASHTQSVINADSLSADTITPIKAEATAAASVNHPESVACSNDGQSTIVS